MAERYVPHRPSTATDSCRVFVYHVPDNAACDCNPRFVPGRQRKGGIHGSSYYLLAIERRLIKRNGMTITIRIISRCNLYELHFFTREADLLTR